MNPTTRNICIAVIRLALAACLVGPSSAAAGELQASTLEVGGPDDIAFIEAILQQL